MFDGVGRIQHPVKITPYTFPFCRWASENSVMGACVTLNGILRIVYCHRMWTNTGVRQYYKQLPLRPLAQKAFDEKCAALIDLLSSVDFHQCLVFSNYHLRSATLSTVIIFVACQKNQMHTVCNFVVQKITLLHSVVTNFIPASVSIAQNEIKQITYI